MINQIQVVQMVSENKTRAVKDGNARCLPFSLVLFITMSAFNMSSKERQIIESFYVKITLLS